ncbi:diguanylate cyclase (GGDEF)-like protein [Rhizobium sp. SG_E_25_P2]|uniref:putative bifunctional diguanylate cyclase/phosphodiesterase n=1 Tax=Rhizobium sp. SG_E_25_P2 TaxID=2879942 RepID=UPI00247464E9|nr:EAL domain-containing protein [Rhizobium sp. SG_E_25_P2]MDH6266615.1 diguanylate cyclase (GGDEF)-like protein [Rhizobium sp. SG_E_25_P2]
MTTILDCLFNQHDLRLVAVAALICIAGSWTAVRLYRRGRAGDGAEQLGWLFLGATAAGSSIWCTHFIAMLAYEAPTGVSFNPVLTVISLLVAIVGGFAGLLIAGGLPFRFGPAIGGGVFGLSIAAMHYIGMNAYVVEGVIDWDRTLTAVSIALAGLLSAASIQIASRDRAMASKGIAVALLALGVVLLHFIGMAAFRVTPMSIGVLYTDPTAMQGMAISVAMVGLIVLGAAFASYLIDGRTQARSLSELRRMALSDMLTGLSNRAHFTDELEQKVRRSRKTGHGFTLAAIDLDRFKEINDMRGHAAGDHTLVVIAERMRAFKTDGVHVFRIGGDEFIALVDGADRTAAASLLTRLRAAVIAPFVIDGYELSVGASIGAARFPDDATNAEQLQRNADLALYRAKAEPADKICFFETEMDEAARLKRELAIDLRRAIENNELRLHYQVQTSVSSGLVTGFEALLRWTHPTRGRIAPSDFIPLAEENGLILPLGEWALKTACRECAHFRKPLKVAVNLSPVQFLHPDLPGLVAATLAETGMRPECLELELTESAIIADKARTLATLLKIRALGVTIALDDFGTGYSSLETLRSFPFDKIKLDRSFMTELESNQQARSIIRAVLALGRSLDIPVLAEGIETRDQLEILHEEGCDTAQGYLLGRPAPFEEINLLTDHAVHTLRNTLWELRAIPASLRTQAV